MAADFVGQQLGNYTLTRLLGRGGFADVYLGEHQYLKSQAAIKILQTRLDSEASLDGFLKEAQTIARLTHPNIIRVLDFGVTDETPYLVMEYAVNGTLRQRHPRNVAIPLATILPYVKQVADALQYAHDERLIHRDIKPENMLLGRRDEVLLSDFGIALTAHSSRSQRTQEAIGTVAYMAPEQIQGKPRPASDQYSLGIVVYEWLTGAQPFQGSFTELCTQHMFAPPPALHEKLKDVSPAVEGVIQKALDKDPHQRFASVQEFAQALEQAHLGGYTVQMLPTSSTPSSISSDTGYGTVAMTGSFGTDASGPRQSYTTQAMNQSGPLSGRPATQGPSPSPLFKAPTLPKTPVPGQQTPTSGQQAPLSNQQATPAAQPESNTQAKTVAPQVTFHSDSTVAQTGPTQGRWQGQSGGQQAAPNFGSAQQQARPQTPYPQQQPQQYYNQPPANQFGSGQFGGPQQAAGPTFPGQQGQYPQQGMGYGQQPAAPFPNQPPQPAYQGQNNFQPNNFQQQAYAQPNPAQGYGAGQGQMGQQQQPQTPQYGKQPGAPEEPFSTGTRDSREQSSALGKERETEKTREPEEDLFSGILGEWKVPILASLGGMILFCLLYNFQPEIWRYNVPVVLAVPLFFGGAFGLWVGLLVGAGGALLSSLFYPNHDILHATLFHQPHVTYASWMTWGIFTLIGFAAGLSMLKKRRFPTISSSVRAFILSVIFVGGSMGYIFYNAHTLQHFLGSGLLALLGLAVGGALLIVYGIVARLIDVGA